MATLEQIARERGLAIPAIALPRPEVAKAPPRIVTLPPEVAIWERENYTNRSHVILIGAGGVGARLAPLLVKHLIPGDAFTIIDHDIVETKNLLRQHFTMHDVGKSKAMIVAGRAEAAAPIPGIIITGVQAKIEPGRDGALYALCPYIDPACMVWQTPGTLNGREIRYRTIVVSAVDSRATRRDIRKCMAQLGSPATWIDCGNDTYTGQALVGCCNLTLTVRAAGLSPSSPLIETIPMEWDGFAELAPDFLATEDAPEEIDCAVRIDTQSVMANMWAATSAATLAIPFIIGSPIVSLGIAFSIRTGATRVSTVQACGYDGETGQYGFVTQRLLA